MPRPIDVGKMTAVPTSVHVVDWWPLEWFEAKYIMVFMSYSQ